MTQSGADTLSEGQQFFLSKGQRFDHRVSDVIAFALAIVIILYAASGPVSELVR